MGIVDNFAFGFALGIMLPLFELIAFAIFTGFEPWYISMHYSTAPITGMTAFIFTIDLIVNIITGLLHRSEAIGHICGNILILGSAFAVFWAISPEATIENFLLLIALSVSLAIGMVVAYLRWRNKDDEQYEDWRYSTY